MSLGFQRSVLTKLGTLIEKRDETLAILRVLLLNATRGVNENEMLEDILPSPLDSTEDLQELCSRLNDEEFRKKMVRGFYNDKIEHTNTSHVFIVKRC